MRTLKHGDKNLHITIKNTGQLCLYPQLKYVTENVLSVCEQKADQVLKFTYLKLQLTSFC